LKSWPALDFGLKGIKFDDFFTLKFIMMQKCKFYSYALLQPIYIAKYSLLPIIVINSYISEGDLKHNFLNLRKCSKTIQQQTNLFPS